MWHVDEGALHAYLDGALDEYPAAEARRVREHLEACTECADRLAEERRVRDEAQGILGLAAPRVEVPTFEELRAYVKAQAPPRSRISVRTYRLSWAASVVLALGTGWLLRGEIPTTSLSPAAGAFTADAAEEAAPGQATTSPTELESASEAAAAAVGARGASPSGAQELLDASGGGSADAAPLARSATPSGAPATASPPPAALDAPATVRAAAPEQGRRETAERLDEVAASRAAGLEPVAEVADAVAPDAAATKVADDSAADVAAMNVRGAVPEPAPAAPTAAQRAAEQRLSSAIRQAPGSGLGAGAPALGRASGSDSSADAGVVNADAEAESVSLVVPGLEVLDVLPVGEGTTFAGMRALQRLPSGDTLETAHLPAGVDARALPPLPVGWSELIRPRGSGWLVMRAPLDEASLAELLQRLESGR